MLRVVPPWIMRNPPRSRSPKNGKQSQAVLQANMCILWMNWLPTCFTEGTFSASSHGRMLLEHLQHNEKDVTQHQCTQSPTLMVRGTVHTGVREKNKHFPTTIGGSSAHFRQIDVRVVIQQFFAPHGVFLALTLSSALSLTENQRDSFDTPPCFEHSHTRTHAFAHRDSHRQGTSSSNHA